MAWANFLLLGIGAGLLSVPVILHFMMQPKPKELSFPALRFVKQRQSSNRSRLRLRHLLLLLLRCLLIGLLALAMAGPSVASQEYGNWLTLGGIGFSTLLVAIVLAASVWVARRRNWILVSILSVLLLGHLIYGAIAAQKLLNSDSARLLGDAQAPIAALVIVDTSPRMMYLQESKTRLDVAKDIGGWLLSQFPGDSQVSVVATDNDQPFFSVDVGAAKKRMETLETSFDSGFIPTSLSEGLRLLRKAPQERKEVYVLTDLTLRSWNAGESGQVARALEADPEISVFVIDVGIEDPQNFAMAPLQLSSEALTSSGGLRIQTSVNRLGPAAQRTVQMKIEKPDPEKARPVIRDGQLLVPEDFWQQTMSVDIRENSSSPVQFQFKEPLGVGTYHGVIEVVGQDALDIDNQQYFTVQVRESWKALVVHPDDVNPANLVISIAPQGLQAAGRSMFECKQVNQREMMVPEGLDRYQAIFLLDPEPMPATTWRILEQYVEAGGGLAVYLGHNAAQGAVAHPDFATEAASRVLSFSLVRQSGPHENLFFSPGNLSHPIFDRIREREDDVAWNNFPVELYWDVKSDELFDELPTQTLIRLGNQRPALVERQIGQGRVLVMTTPITEPARPANNRTPWNKLFLGEPVPAWLLTRGMARYLVQSSSDKMNLDVGQIASLRNDATIHPETYNVYSPRKPVTAVQLNVANGRIRYRFTDTPGHYRLKGILSGPVVRGFSVNLQAADTDLSRIDKEQLDQFLGAGRYQLARQKTEIQRKQGTSRRGQEFYPLLIVMLIVVLGVEYLMSNRFYSSSMA